MKEITIKHRDSVLTFKVDLAALKAEMIGVENKIREVKKILHKPHTVKTSEEQSKLAMDLKPWATYLYALRTALRGKMHNSFLNPTNPGDTRSPQQRQDATLVYWLTNRYGYKPSFLIKE